MNKLDKIQRFFDWLNAEKEGFSSKGYTLAILRHVIFLVLVGFILLFSALKFLQAFD